MTAQENAEDVRLQAAQPDPSVPIRVPEPAVPEGRGRRGPAVKSWAGRLVLIVPLLLIAGLVLVPQLLASGDPTAPVSTALTAPSPDHWFGTDDLGRDVFTRTVWGARPIIVSSLIGILISTVAGVTMGLLGGLAPPFVSGLIMRVLDVILALPALLIALMVVAIAGSGPTSVVVAVGVAYAPAFARVVYGSVRRLRTTDYVAAARVFGGSQTHNVFRHLLPNLTTEIAVLVSSALGWALLTAGTLSFLGFGVSLPAPDWGVDLASGGQYLGSAWWISTFPGLAITGAILLSNYLGDSVGSLLDPHRSTTARQQKTVIH
jgi:peptide/nickel transport system permease protein